MRDIVSSANTRGSINWTKLSSYTIHSHTCVSRSEQEPNCLIHSAYVRAIHRILQRTLVMIRDFTILGFGISEKVRGKRKHGNHSTYTANCAVRRVCALKVVQSLSSAHLASTRTWNANTLVVWYLSRASVSALNEEKCLHDALKKLEILHHLKAHIGQIYYVLRLFGAC